MGQEKNQREAAGERKVYAGAPCGSRLSGSLMHPGGREEDSRRHCQVTGFTLKIR